MKLIENYIPKTEIEYKKLYQQSIKDPNSFWSDIASTFTWKKKWNKTFEFDFKKPDFKWFIGGKLYITENCLDRHLTKKAEKRGMDVKEFASKVTSNPDKYDTRTVRQANLAKTLNKLRKRKKK